MPSSERDWQHMRRVHGIALDRFCTRLLDEAVAVARGGGSSAHARYLRRFRLLHERDAAMAAAFDDMRRSTGLHRLRAMVGLGVLAPEDLAGFSPDVQAAARDLSQVGRPAGPPRRSGTRSRLRSGGQSGPSASAPS